MGNNTERFWALAAFNLTVAARETYIPQTEAIAEPAKLTLGALRMALGAEHGAHERAAGCR
jgi:hypothetical protein